MTKLVTCVRCNGRKKMYKTGSAYTSVDIGGTLVDCPLCNGAGKYEHQWALPKAKPQKQKAIKRVQENDKELEDTTNE